MRTNVKKVLIAALCVLLLLSMPHSEIPMSALAEGWPSEQKIYSAANIDDAFADNRIMLVLNNEASLQYLQTETFNFSEVKPVNIQRFTESKGKEIKAMVTERDKTSLAERILTADSSAAAISDYREVLCIELPEHSKENVLEAIALLEKREDVLYAGPDYDPYQF